MTCAMILCGCLEARSTRLAKLPSQVAEETKRLAEEAAAAKAAAEAAAEEARKVEAAKRNGKVEVR